MDNARVTYFGSGTLSLQMMRFPSGKEMVCRLDNILGPERLKHRDGLLVVGMDGRLINVGRYVPTEAFEKAWAENKIIDDGHTGFMIAPPEGYHVHDDGPYLVLMRREEALPARGSPEQFEKFVDAIVAAGSPDKDIKEDETAVITEQQVRESKVDLPVLVAADLGNKASKQASMPPKHGSKKQRGKRVKGEEGVPQDLLEAI